MDKKYNFLFLPFLGALFMSLSLCACAISSGNANERETLRSNPANASTKADSYEGSVSTESKEQNINMGTYLRITHEEALERMDSGEALIILDVRTPQEFTSGHIKGAINLPLDQITEQAEVILPDKDAEILLYCRSGNRSKTASFQLLDLGYTHIADFGGITGWTGEIE